MAQPFPDDETESTKFYENPKQYTFNDCKYSLLIVGPSGAGKSAFCNFLLKEKKFEESTGLCAGTEKAAHFTFSCEDGNILVVDCPGFCDPKRSHEEIMKEISKASILCRDGMDAIGIVIDPTTRFSEAQKISLELMESFGGEFWKHSFIIFNHEKKIQKKLKFNDASDYINTTMNDPKCSEEFKKLLNKVEKRFICVESSKKWNDEDYWGKIRDGVLAMVLQAKLNNGNSYVNCFMEHGKLTYNGLVGMWEEIRVEIEALKVLENQNQRRQKSSLDKLKEHYMKIIRDYEKEIGNLREKVNTRTSTKNSTCTVM